MKVKKFYSVIVCFVTFLFAGIQVYAQDHPNTSKGFSAESLHKFGEIDNVNVFNGNLTIKIPLGSPYQVNGNLSYGLNLIYNSNCWDFTVDLSGNTDALKATPLKHSNAGLGWTLSMGKLIFTAPNSQKPAAYVSPDDSLHGFFSILRQGDADEPGDTLNNQRTLYTRDGSYMRVRVISPSLYAVDFPNGTVTEFGSDGLPVRIYGPFNNPQVGNQQIDIDYFPNRWEIRDSHGRVQKVYFMPTGLPSPSITNVVSRVELTSFNDVTNASPAIYQFNYTNVSLPLPCPHLPQGEFMTVPLLTSLVLPDNSSYQMPTGDYITGGSASCHTIGKIERITLPTLGKIEWAYGIYSYPQESSAKHPNRNSQGVVSRKLIDVNGVLQGTWTYSPALIAEPPRPVPPPNPSKEFVNTVTVNTIGPAGTTLQFKTKHYFSVFPFGNNQNDWSVIDYGLPFTRFKTDVTGTRFLSAETFDANNNLLRSVYVRYENDAAPGFSYTGDEAKNLNRRLTSKRIVFDNDLGQEGNPTYIDEDYSDFNGLGHYRRQSSGGNLTNTNARVTVTNYSSAQPGPVSPWILGLYDEETITEAGVTAKTEFEFDTNTGFLKRERTLKTGTTRNARDIFVRYTPDSNGNVSKEEYFGGDKQAGLPPTAISTLNPGVAEYELQHTYSYGIKATSKHKSASFYTLDQVIDGNTGLVIESRDASGSATTYEYNKMGQLISARPENESFTQYEYTLATSSSNLARVDMYQKDPRNGAIITHEQVRFDGFGRLWKDQILMPGDVWSVRETLYNALGWKISRSECGDTSKKTLYFDYDPYGRPGRIQPPDGTAHNVTLLYGGERVVIKTFNVGTSYNGTSVVETPVSTVERYDNQGRLIQLTEDFTSGAPGSVGHGVAQPVTTKYSYDIGNRLSRVSTTANAGGASVTQDRTLNYDNRGFLTSESHPEKGNSTTPGTVNYPIYDTRGHLLRQEDAGQILDYFYDQSERIIRIKDGSGRLLKEYAYGTSNAGSDLRNGKLVTAIRHNYVDPPGGPAVELDISVTETYYYKGLGGRISQRDTQLNTGQAFTQSFEYDKTGQITKINYPDCLHGDCTDEAAMTDRRTVTNAYSRGQLVSVTDSVTGSVNTVGYHLNRMLNQVGHANGVNDRIEVNASNKMPRPHRIFTSNALTANGLAGGDWDSGVYSYDGADNIIRIGADYFTYDRKGRLTEGTAFASGNRKQSYAYDAFHNLFQKTTTVNGAATVESLAVNARKNRLTSATYDARGNIVLYQGRGYIYDELNLVKYAPGKVFIYTADDERLWTYDYSGPTLRETYSLRDLDGRLLREYLNEGGSVAGTWKVTKDYLYRGDSLLSSWSPTEGTRHFHLDHLGSPRLITDQNKRRVALHTYYPFGQEASIQTQDSEKLKFSGHERDFNGAGDADDLDYMHARYYSASIGKFLSIDPVKSWDAKKPGSWNRYTYALNNPMKYTDPTGESPTIATGLAGAGVGALVGGGIELFSQLVVEGKSLNQVEWRDVGASAANGAVTGGVAGLTGGASLLASGALNGGALVVGGALERGLDSDPTTKSLDSKEARKDVLLGAGGAGVSKVAGKIIDKAGKVLEKGVKENVKSVLKGVRPREIKKEIKEKVALARLGVNTLKAQVQVVWDLWPGFDSKNGKTNQQQK